MLHKEEKMNKRKIVGYISTFYEEAEASVIAQKEMIQRYCEEKKLVCHHIFCDKGRPHNRRQAEIAQAEELGLSTKRWRVVYEQLEEMLLQIKQDKIGTILVDSVRRLHFRKQHKKVFEQLVKEHNVEIIEVGLLPVIENEGKEAVIYYYTTEKDLPYIMLQRLDDLYKEAAHQGWAVKSLFIDNGLYSRPLYGRLLNETVDNKKYGAIFVYSLYYLNRSSLATFNILNNIMEQNIFLYSITEGEINMEKGERYFERKLKVAIYDRARSNAGQIEQLFLKEKMEIFCRIKTNWKIHGWYVTEDEDKNQDVFNTLVNDIDKYDLIIVNHFASIHPSIHQFFKQKNLLKKKPIFCIKNGDIIK